MAGYQGMKVQHVVVELLILALLIYVQTSWVFLDSPIKAPLTGLLLVALVLYPFSMCINVAKSNSQVDASSTTPNPTAPAATTRLGTTNENPPTYDQVMQEDYPAGGLLQHAPANPSGGGLSELELQYLEGKEVVLAVDDLPSYEAAMGHGPTASTFQADMGHGPTATASNYQVDMGHGPTATASNYQVDMGHGPTASNYQAAMGHTPPMPPWSGHGTLTSEGPEGAASVFM